MFYASTLPIVTGSSGAFFGTYAIKCQNSSLLIGALDFQHTIKWCRFHNGTAPAMSIGRRTYFIPIINYALVITSHREFKRRKLLMIEFDNLVIESQRRWQLVTRIGIYHLERLRRDSSGTQIKDNLRIFPPREGRQELINPSGLIDFLTLLLRNLQRHDIKTITILFDNSHLIFRALLLFCSQCFKIHLICNSFFHGFARRRILCKFIPNKLYRLTFKQEHLIVDTF